MTKIGARDIVLFATNTGEFYQSYLCMARAGIKLPGWTAHVSGPVLNALRQASRAGMGTALDPHRRRDRTQGLLRAAHCGGCGDAGLFADTAQQIDLVDYINATARK
jgi:hypothetical protein